MYYYDELNLSTVSNRVLSEMSLISSTVIFFPQIGSFEETNYEMWKRKSDMVLT